MDSKWKIATISLGAILLASIAILIASQFGLLSSSTEEMQLNGEVFIVTRGRENFKLGLVPIKVIEIGDNEPVYAGEVIVETKTDADGEFSIRLPKGRYKIFAYAKRDIFGKVEIYNWAVPVALTKDGQTIFLSNDNLSASEE